mgnify:FL=1
MECNHRLPLYSAVRWNTDKDGVTTLHLQNVCVDTTQASLHLYCHPSECDKLQKQISQFPEGNRIAASLLVDFRSSKWSFTLHTEEQPRANRIDKSGCYLSQKDENAPLEVISFIAHLVHNHATYPTVPSSIALNARWRSSFCRASLWRVSPSSRCFSKA